MLPSLKKIQSFFSSNHDLFLKDLYDTTNGHGQNLATVKYILKSDIYNGYH